MKTSKKLQAILVTGVLALVPGVLFASNTPAPSAPSGPEQALERQVREQIKKLPYYSVFDNLKFSVDGDQVTLEGQVIHPVVRESAIEAVGRIDGVGKVVDQIEVFPLSPNDDYIRIQAYYAIFGYPSLSRYALNARPTIHILVKNGNVTLEGFVTNTLDRQLAENRVAELPGIFSVTNHLRLDSRTKP